MRRHGPSERGGAGREQRWTEPHDVPNARASARHSGVTARRVVIAVESRWCCVAEYRRLLRVGGRMRSRWKQIEPVLVAGLGATTALGALAAGWGLWILGYRPPSDTPGIVIAGLAILTGGGVALLAMIAHAALLPGLEHELRRRCRATLWLLAPAALVLGMWWILGVKSGALIACALVAAMGIGQIVAALGGPR
jgi:hypothetical protein